jgi:hypothetical protein
MTKPYTAGPWHWVDADDDEPLDMTGTDDFGAASLRSVKEYGNSVLTGEPIEETRTDVVDGKSYTSFALPKFIANVEELEEGEEMAANYRLLMLAPDLADYVYERAAAGDPVADKLVAKIEGRDGPPTP